MKTTKDKPKTLTPASGLQMIPLGKLISNPEQPRRHWDQMDEDGVDAIARLAQSIKAEGIIQPLVVTPKEGKFLIVCGERRFRAAKKVGLKDAPSVVRPGLSDTQILELSITENLQREDLTPVDEAHAIRTLMDRCRYTQKDVAGRLGVSVPAINYKLSLLKLTPDIQKEIRRGDLNETQGREIAQAASKSGSTKEERDEVMKQIKSRMDKMRKSNGKQLTTKDVKSIAKTVVKERAKPRKAKKAKPSAPRVKPTETKPPTAKEKREAQKFFQVLANATKGFKPFSLQGDSGLRFATVLLAVKPDARDDVKKLHGILFVLVEAIAEVKRQRLIAKATK